MRKRQSWVPTYVGTLESGFTLIELLIVISIIIVLLVFVLMNLQGQIAKANDAKRKSDLYTLKNAIEEYNNDHTAFPPQNSVASCDGNGLSPYINQIPCDPVSRNPYGYFLSAATGGYRVCAILSDKTDPAIAAMGCSGSSGCGLSGGYNYCLAQGTTASAVGTADQSGGTGSVPTATPAGGGGGAPITPTPGFHNACAPPDINGISYCNYYADPAGSGCPTTYSDRTCNNDCRFNPAVRCTQ